MPGPRYGLYRALQSLIPAPWAGRLLWPAAAVVAAWGLMRGPARVRDFDRLPPPLRPSCSRPAWVVRLWRGRARWWLAKTLVSWPGWLRDTPRAPVYGFTGLEHLEGAVAAGRPVILATLHYGPILALRLLLRFRGWAAAGLTGLPPRAPSAYPPAWDRIDELRGLAGIPHQFHVSQLRRAIDFLRPGRILVVAVDGARGRRVLAEADGWGLVLSSGALRLAARTHAAVIPCLVSADPRQRLVVRLDQPIPPEWLADPGCHAMACARLLSAFAPMLRACPELCQGHLLRRFHTLPSAETNPEPTDASRASP